MTLTKKIAQSLARITSEDHTNEKGVTEMLFDSVGPIFDRHEAFFPLRPSSCLKPMRDLFYDLKNFYKPGSIPKADFPSRVKLIFQFGHMTEDLLKRVFKHKFEVLFEQEQVKYGELIELDGTTRELKGAIDWAVKLDSSSESLTLVDSKSSADYPFKKSPKEDHIAQLQLYMHSDWGRKNKVDKAMLVYFNKNTSDIKTISFDYDADLAKKILDRMTYVYECFKKDSLPEREYLVGLDYQADYSSYKDYDNLEFTIPVQDREVVEIKEYYKPIKYTKDEIRAHEAKFVNRIAKYLDKNVYLVYSEYKLQLVVDAI